MTKMYALDLLCNLQRINHEIRYPSDCKEHKLYILFVWIFFKDDMIELYLFFLQARKMYVNTIANCKDFENSPLNWSQITFDRDPVTKDFSFNIELTVHREVSKKFGVSNLTILRLWFSKEAGLSTIIDS